MKIYTMLTDKGIILKISIFPTLIYKSNAIPIKTPVEFFRILKVILKFSIYVYIHIHMYVYIKIYIHVIYIYISNS